MTLVEQITSLSLMARRLVAMRFLAHVGMLASYFIGILGTLAYSLGGDALSTTFSVGLINLAIVVGNFAGGALLDAWGPRRHFALSVAFTCASAVLFQCFSDTVTGILACSAAFGFAWGVEDIVARSYPAYVTDDAEQLACINPALSAVTNLTVVIGPLVGSAITSVFSTKAVFLFGAACALLGLVPAAGFRPLRAPLEGEEAECSDSSLSAGFAAVAASSSLRLLLAIGFLAFFGYGAFDPLESLYYRDVLDVGVEWMGWLSSAAGVGAIAGSVALMRLPARFVNMRSLLWALFGMGVGCLVYIGTSSVAVALVGQVMLGCAFGVIGPLQTTLVQMHAPLSALGRVSAVMGFGHNAAGVVPLLMAPWLAGRLGVQETLVLASALVAASSLAGMVVFRKRVDRAVEEERLLGTDQGSRR